MQVADERNVFGDYYRIGLDIGIASVGWACLACDSEGNVKHILDLGVRTFDIPENPKDGSSLAAPRREKRSLRRRIRRREHRMERARALLGVGKEEPDGFKGEKREDVYELRYRALDGKISERDFARVLMLILKRRGYQSNSKRDKDADAGKVKEAIAANENTMAEKGYRTVGEMLYCECARDINGVRTYDVRNHGDYKLCVSRASLLDEIHTLFAAQRKFGNALATEQTEEKFAEIFSAQRDFDDGPGAGSKYSAEYKVGDCPFEKGEKRAAKNTFSFEYFRLLQSLNHVRVISDGSSRFLSEEERRKALEKCLYKESVKYSDLRKYIGLSDEEFFDSVYYAKDKQIKDAEKVKFCGMPGSAKIRSKLSAQHKDDTALLDTLAEILSRSKSDRKIKEAFEKPENAICAELTQEEKDGLCELSLSGFGHIGLKAIKKVLPYLEQGEIYSTAMEHAGYDHSNPFGEVEKAKFIDANDPKLREELEDITSPAVKRAVSQTIKTVNAIIRKYNSPVAINVELARELGKSKEKRDEIKKDNDRRQKAKDSDIDIIKSLEISNPTSKQILKYRLYNEQQCKSIYSGKDFDLHRVLTDEKYAEVDHIIPYSRSFCDAYYNKVLVLTEENQKKGNAIPREYFNNESEWERFCRDVNSTIHNIKKKEMLLCEKFTKEDGKGWKDRSLNDTKYISRFIYNLFRNRLLFAECDMGKRRVMATTGEMTAKMLGLWGVKKVREDGDLHHALDAIAIGCVDSKFVKDLTKWSQAREMRYSFKNGKAIDRETGEIIDMQMLESYSGKFPMPHSEFRKEIEMRLSDNPNLYDPEYPKFGYDSSEMKLVRKVFVSRAPERKAKGAIHLDTVYSRDKAGNTTLKTELTKLKLKDGEIENYNELAKQSDILLYNALRDRLMEFDGDAKKAFAEPFHKPKADGSDGPIVKKVIIDQGISAPVNTGRGSAKNGSMVRTDVFCKNGKYYGVPVYAKDVYGGQLPNKAVTAGKGEDEWIEMTDEYEYKFSLYMNDLVLIESKKGIKFSPQNKDNPDKILNCTLAYYKGFNRANGAMEFILHDNSYSASSIGIQGLKTFIKYEVDILGNVHEVKNEKRPPAQMKQK